MRQFGTADAALPEDLSLEGYPRQTPSQPRQHVQKAYVR